MPATASYVNLAAEVRAVEAGHHARLDADGRALLVTSDSEPGVTRRVTVEGRMGFVAGTCSCPAGRNRFAPRGLGVAQCMHIALVCRRLEREGLASFDGERWVTTPKAEKAAPVVDDDPFAGLPKGWN